MAVGRAVVLPLDGDVLRTPARHAVLARHVAVGVQLEHKAEIIGQRRASHDHLDWRPDGLSLRRYRDLPLIPARRGGVGHVELDEQRLVPLPGDAVVGGGDLQRPLQRDADLGRPAAVVQIPQPVERGRGQSAGLAPGRRRCHLDLRERPARGVDHQRRRYELVPGGLQPDPLGRQFRGPRGIHLREQRARADTESRGLNEGRRRGLRRRRGQREPCRPRLRRLPLPVSRRPHAPQAVHCGDGYPDGGLGFEPREDDARLGAWLRPRHEPPRRLGVADPAPVGEGPFHGRPGDRGGPVLRRRLLRQGRHGEVTRRRERAFARLRAECHEEVRLGAALLAGVDVIVRSGLARLVGDEQSVRGPRHHRVDEIGVHVRFEPAVAQFPNLGIGDPRVAVGEADGEEVRSGAPQRAGAIGREPRGAHPLLRAPRPLDPRRGDGIEAEGAQLMVVPRCPKPQRRPLDGHLAQGPRVEVHEGEHLDALDPQGAGLPVVQPALRGVLAEVRVRDDLDPNHLRLCGDGGQ